MAASRFVEILIKNGDESSGEAFSSVGYHTSVVSLRFLLYCISSANSTLAHFHLFSIVQEPDLLPY